MIIRLATSRIRYTDPSTARRLASVDKTVFTLEER
jgi:hypothetical protein